MTTGYQPLKDIKPARLRLLFVDDNHDQAELMARCAVALGHEAVWTGTETEARVLLSSREWDGMISDWWLEPEKIVGGGGRLIAYSRRLGKTFPCILMTGFPTLDFGSIASIMEQLGDVVCLQKPQDPESLISIIRCMIDEKTKLTEGERDAAAQG